MDHRTARKIQFILLFIGALVGCVGAWGFNNTIAVLIGLGIMVVSVIVWWLFCSATSSSAARTRSAARAAAHGSEKVPSPAPKRRRYSTKRKSTERGRRTA